QRESSRLPRFAFGACFLHVIHGLSDCLGEKFPVVTGVDEHHASTVRVVNRKREISALDFLQKRGTCRSYRVHGPSPYSFSDSVSMLNAVAAFPWLTRRTAAIVARPLGAGKKKPHLHPGLLAGNSKGSASRGRDYAADASMRKRHSNPGASSIRG